MPRKILVSIIILAHVSLLMGCRVTSVEKVHPQEASRDAEWITGLVLLDGTNIVFGTGGGRYAVQKEVILGRSVDGAPLAVPLDSLRRARTFHPPYPAAEPRAVSLEAFKEQALLGYRVYDVVDMRNRVFAFDSAGGTLEHLTGFVGSDVTGRFSMTPAESVLYASVQRVNVGGTVLANLAIVVGVAGTAVLIALATKQSCPFIYSYCDRGFVFDAEPLGGAIAPGLARTDISRLDFAKPVGGEYRLLIRNEVEETQYLDRMRLLVMDHDPALQVYPALSGGFYGFTHILQASSATDEQGKSLMNFFRAGDGIAWQTNLAAACRDSLGPVRHEITVILPRPPRARRAWLITNIGTSSWGSNMIRKTVEYRGNGAGPWLASLTPGSNTLLEMNQFLEREESYHLKVWMKEGSSWSPRGVILGQGPLITEDRVYPIDISGAAGDSLVLRFNPPKGYWTIDYIAVSYDEPAVLTPLFLEPAPAINREDGPVCDSLRRTDQQYFAMPEVGNSAFISFPAPPPSDGKTRSVYLETTGYYELHLAVNRQEQLARLVDIGMNPGQIVRTAMQEYRAWLRDRDLATFSSRP